jgi:hypothetical protein
MNRLDGVGIDVEAANKRNIAIGVLTQREALVVEGELSIHPTGFQPLINHLLRILLIALRLGRSTSLPFRVKCEKITKITKITIYEWCRPAMHHVIAGAGHISMQSPHSHELNEISVY